MANVYRHHKNKPRLGHRIYGRVIHSHYNHGMHRVELIIELDTDKAPDLRDKIDDGEYPPLSMGARVPYDVCSICGNKAKTLRNYCTHAKNSMNKILPDGRKVYVRNDNPKFFDISFVHVPADRTAYVMAKVASTNEVKLSAENAEEIMKNAGIKEADIVKRIDSGKIESASPDPKGLILDSQPNMPDELIKQLSKEDLSKVLSTLLGMRIIPKRKEFQRLVLMSNGKGAEADDYDRRGIVFSVDDDTEPVMPYDVDPRFSSENVAKQICAHDGYVKRAPMTKPIIIMRLLEKHANLDDLTQKGSRMEQEGIVPPLMDEPFDPMTREGVEVERGDVDEAYRSPNKNPIIATTALAGLYYGLTRKLSGRGLLDSSLIKHPWLIPILIGGASMGSLLLQKKHNEKTAGFAPNIIARSLISVPTTYLYAGAAEGRARRGEELGKYEDFVRKHPLIASMIHTYGLGKAQQVLGKLDKLGSYSSSLMDLSDDALNKLYGILINY